MDKNLEIFGLWSSAQDKFDLFVLAILMTICAYLVQTLEFVVLGLNLETVQILSLVVFGLSIVAAFRRIETMTVVYRVNHQLIQAKEDNDTERATQAYAGLNKLAAQALFWYRTRNRLMLLGFLLYFLSRLASPYFGVDD